MSDERRYSQKELHAIFERAAKRQEEARHAEAASAGDLTLVELQEIGVASGIDPAHIAAAAAEVARGERTGAPQRRGRWPRQVLVERVLPGPISDEAWEAMVGELRRSLRKPGVAGQVGRTREWTTMSTGGRNPDVPVSVTLRPEGNQTRLTIMQSWEEYTHAPLIMASIFSFMALLLGGVFAFNEPTALFMPVILAVLALLIFGAGPAAMQAMARRQAAKFERILDRLDLIARDTVSETGATGAQKDAALAASEPSPEPTLRLDTDEAPESQAAPAHRNRTRS